MNFFKRLIITLMFKAGIITIIDDDYNDISEKCFVIDEDGMGRLITLDEHEQKLSK